MTTPLHRPERATARGYRWALLSWFEVPDLIQRDLVYLRRLRIIQTPWFGIYLHWIYLPDADRDPHDHPWPFVSWVLRGGYTEQIHTRFSVAGQTVTRVAHRKWARWSVHRMGITTAHRILTLEPNTVTLVLVGRRSRSFGFWTLDGWVPWRRYVAQHRASDSE